jgi:thiol:disulfide interchange protein DsbD
MNLLASKEVVLLRADKTQPNPAIDAALKSLNRRSVPVNALYVPGEKTPQITSEILTPGYLLDFFKEQLDKGTDQQVK